MSNGTVTLTLAKAVTVELEAGHLALLPAWARSYGMGVRALTVTGSAEAPHVQLHAQTTRPGHRFSLCIGFDYRPATDLDEAGHPFGFHLTSGTVRLLTPSPGQRHLAEPVDGPAALAAVLEAGEAAFVQVATAYAVIHDRGGR